MTLKAALDSGRDHRRKGKLIWLEGQFNANRTYTAEEIQADDWEVKREPRVIYINEYEDGLGGNFSLSEYEILSMRDTSRDSRPIKFIEVMED